MITADQILVHMVGDYVVQSDWMAANKTQRSWPCLVHVILYVLPFLFLSQSLAALAVIAATHFVIDRWRLARYLCWIKNFIGRDNPAWSECRGTGYPDAKPVWLTVWLMILADNTVHVLINGLAIRYL